MNWKMQELPLDVAQRIFALRRRRYERQQRTSRLLEEAERRRDCADLKWHAWYSTSALAGLLGIDRQQLGRDLPLLSTRRSQAYGGCTYIRADEKLEDMCRLRFINVRLGNRAPTIARPNVLSEEYA